jgi:hypothetical protein
VAATAALATDYTDYTDCQPGKSTEWRKRMASVEGHPEATTKYGRSGQLRAGAMLRVFSWRRNTAPLLANEGFRRARFAGEELRHFRKLIGQRLQVV